MKEKAEYLNSREWQMGYDAGRNLPNTINCHFTLFATSDQCNRWMAGNQQGRQDKMLAESEERIRKQFAK